MQLFQKSAGLKIWLGIWVLVLLVPTWRQSARQQWQGSTVVFNAFENGLTRERLSQMAARTPGDFEPALELFRQRSFSIGGSNSPTTDSPPLVRFFDDYAALSRRFPRENAIRQAWLLDVTRGPLQIESAALYARLGPNRRPNTVRPNWIAPRQLEAALNAAREGAALEPQNSFFPWMESALLFAQRRPDEALQALERASKCQIFDDGTRQTVKRQLALLSRFQTLNWSDRLRVQGSLLLPHFAKISGTGRAALEIAARDYARGERRSALKITSVVARAGATLSDSNDLEIAVLIGDIIQRNAWQSALKNAKVAIAKPKNAARTAQENLAERVAADGENARRVAILARESGKESIAKQVFSTLPALRSDRLAIGLNAPIFESNGVSQRAKRLAMLFWLQGQLMRLSLAGAVAWLATVLLARRADVTTARPKMALWAAFCIGATAFCMGAGALLFGIDTFENLARPGYDDYRNRISLWGDYGRHFQFFLGLLWVFPAALAALWQSAKTLNWRFDTRNPGSLRSLQWLFYVLLAANLVAVIWLRSRQFGKEGGFPVEDFYQWAVWSAIIAIGVGAAWHLATTRGRARFGALLFWCAPLLILTSQTLLSPSEAGQIALSLGFAQFCVVASAYLTHWRPAPATQLCAFDFGNRLRTLAAILAVASAISYLGVKIAAAPAERNLNALIDLQLEIGEVAWLESREEKMGR